MMSRTFGAPAGAATAFGKSGLESFAVRPMTPWNGGSGTGSTGEPPVGGFAAGLSAAWRSHGSEAVIAPSTTVSASRGSLAFIVNSSHFRNQSIPEVDPVRWMVDSFGDQFRTAGPLVAEG